MKQFRDEDCNCIDNSCGVCQIHGEYHSGLNPQCCGSCEESQHELFSTESTTNDKGELVYVCQKCYAEIPSDKVNYKEMYN